MCMCISYMHEGSMNISTNFLSFETFKTVAPLVACLFCFVICLFVFKFLFRTNRYNPAIYICSTVTVCAAYFLFIKTFNLGRIDYFLDGVKFCLGWLNDFSHFTLEKLLIPVFAILLSNKEVLTFCANTFTIVLIFLHQTNIHKIILFKLTLKNLKFAIKYVFKNTVKYIASAVGSFLTNVLSVHKINCVYSC